MREEKIIEDVWETVLSKKEKTIFITEDGQKFSDKNKAEEHDARLKAEIVKDNLRHLRLRGNIDSYDGWYIVFNTEQLNQINAMFTGLYGSSYCGILPHPEGEFPLILGVECNYNDRRGEANLDLVFLSLHEVWPDNKFIEDEDI